MKKCQHFWVRLKSILGRPAKEVCLNCGRERVVKG
jgi:hypothetical protein